MKTISRLYRNYDQAAQAVRDLEAAGVPHKDVSIVANNADNWYDEGNGVTKRVDRDADGVDDRAEGAAAGAGIGAAAGGAAGLLAGLGLLAIPESAQWLPLAGLSPPRPVPQQAAQRAASSVH